MIRQYFSYFALFAGLLSTTFPVYAADKFAATPVWQIYQAEEGAGGALSHPGGVACHGTRIAVADTDNDRIVFFDLEGDRLGLGRSCKPAGMKSPKRLHFLPNGELVVQDGRPGQLLRLDSAGELLGVIKPKGLPDNRPLWIGSFAIAGGDSILILDIASHRLLVLSAGGAFQKAISLPESSGIFSDVTVDDRGTIYVLDSVEAKVYAKAKSDATFKPVAESLDQYMNFPTHIAADRQGFLLITDHNGGGVVRLDRKGNFKGRVLSLGWKRGQLYYPRQLATTETGEIIIADTGNSRIQIFRESSD